MKGMTLIYTSKRKHFRVYLQDIMVVKIVVKE